MPFYFAPNSDKRRLAFLRQAVQMEEKLRADGGGYLSDEALEAAGLFLAQFEAAHRRTHHALSERMERVALAQAAMARLRTYVRDVWEAIRRRVRREELAPALLRHYMLTSAGRAPRISGRAQWLEVAERVVGGDATAVAAGYRPLAEPAAAELQAVLDAAGAAVRASRAAEQAYLGAQKGLAVLRPRADELCDDVISELRFRLRKYPLPRQRRLMRIYGARFRYRPGEAREEVDALPVGDPEGQRALPA